MSKAIIPVRRITTLHTKADEEFMERYGKIYARRDIVECVFSAMKRRFGGVLWSRKEELKFKEMLLIVIAYNAWRKVELCFIFVVCFLQGLILEPATSDNITSTFAKAVILFFFKTLSLILK